MATVMASQEAKKNQTITTIATTTATTGDNLTLDEREATLKENMNSLTPWDIMGTGRTYVLFSSTVTLLDKQHRL